MARLWSAGIDVHVDRRLAMPPREKAAATTDVDDDLVSAIAVDQRAKITYLIFDELVMVERRDLFGGKLRLCVHAHSRISHHADSTISDSPSRRSEEHTSELQSLMRISYAVFCLKKKTTNKTYIN